MQVAYYRKQQWQKLTFDRADIDLPGQVIKHFRDIEDIKRLAHRAGLTIEVIKKEFSHGTRVDYHRYVCKDIDRIKGPKIVFLDPDVGLAPNKGTAGHVMPDEVLMIWQSLNPEDFLVFYQHRFRQTSWVEIRRKQLAEACGVERDQVRKWSAEQIAEAQRAKDVVLFFVEKV